ncbi:MULTISPECIES: hypothetical protein [unclassified Agarivorans]|uniref:hypothetical protein n=1 Tax=unclassified Agarivorans TaxID=2636026 RepID=UPI0026E21A1D|nr:MULTISPECIES: hypothetical protein [unclassified Agarivorans]MDO6684366.1 hypothetical protein [Agarivorans sp. 3_MG-2023]MDO6714531.1 hypothetical protein [Agarivorans sp. 2_MG-2023]
MSKCGQCRQFTRTPDNQKDLCGAWEQPTLATRTACDFFMPKKTHRHPRASASETST